MCREVWPRRSVRVLLLLVAALLLLQYSVNFFGYTRDINDLVWRKMDELGLLGLRTYPIDSAPIKVVFAENYAVFNPSPEATPAGWSIYDDEQSHSSMPICPLFPPKLRGSLPVSKRPVEIEAVNALYAQYFKRGGFYSPSNCRPSQKVAIVIPFRDRDAHLYIFLFHMIPILMRQQLEFTIYVIDQAPGSKFNRGMLMNIGFAEALKDKNYTCFVFHDVDLLPENDHNIYSCNLKSPRHMSAAVDKFDYKLPYAAIFGGASAITKDHFLRVNGFSNVFFGWGAEDDDMYRRMKRQKLKLTRYPLSIARYTMLKHGHAGNKAAQDRFVYLNGKGGDSRLAIDGVNSLKYQVEESKRNALYTKVTVAIDQWNVRRDLDKKLKSLRRLFSVTEFSLGI